VITKYVYDGDQIIAEYDANDTLLRKFVCSDRIDEPVSMTNYVGGTTVCYYYFDVLGNVIALANSSGAILEKYSYDVFGTPTIRNGQGNVISQSAYGNPYMFTGRAFDDECGNYYYRARYYKSSISRFLQPDPIGYMAGLNLYTYCNNNPVIYIDPWGLAKLTVHVKRHNKGGHRDSKRNWGHAWVEGQSDSGERINRGSYPKGLRDDTGKNSTADVSRSYEISESQFEKLKQGIENYGDDNWNRISENCVDFVYKAAEDWAGVDLPGSDWGLDTPDQLADDLKKGSE
jgi:RHS repeat-associated protein